MELHVQLYSYFIILRFSNPWLLCWFNEFKIANYYVTKWNRKTPYALFYSLVSKDLSLRDDFYRYLIWNRLSYFSRHKFVQQCWIYIVNWDVFSFIVVNRKKCMLNVNHLQVFAQLKYKFLWVCVWPVKNQIRRKWREILVSQEWWDIFILNGRNIGVWKVMVHLQVILGFF